MISPRLELVRPQQLREHEETDPNHLREMFRAIEADGVLRKPLAVDFLTLVVLDGVHRLNVLKQLGCRRVPACLVDYSSDDIVVHSRDGRTISKEEVIDAALSGKKFPPRTTWHMVKMADGSLVHISCIEKEHRLPLVTLANKPER